jgi:AraC family transcriptional regulator
MAEDSDIDIRPIFETEDFGAELNSELRERGAALRAKTVGLNLPTFQDGPELLIAGLSRRYTSESRVAIPRQWEDFVPRAAELSPSPGASWFGVCSNCAPDDSFDYLTGVELAEARSIPHGLTSLQLAPRRYVVFAHTGHVSTMPKTIDVIWKQWAPECGLKIARNGPCVERYTSEFNPQTGMGGMEIWIPLEA